MNKKKSVVFMGDSITDTFRTSLNDKCLELGGGYPMMISSQFELEYPNMPYEFINRGISGNRVTELYARWEEDVLKLNPYILSILIGVNDVWHELDGERGTSLARFERTYNYLIEETKSELPHCKIMILEPFILEMDVVLENRELWIEQMNLRREVVNRVSQNYGCKFVPLQEEFNEAAAQSAPENWLVDGVHPTAAGHALIARQWRKAFNELEKEYK